VHENLFRCFPRHLEFFDFHFDQVGKGHGRGRLKSLQAWSPRTCNVGQWMQLDTGEVQSIAGVLTQGRHEAPQWVTSLIVQACTRMILNCLAVCRCSSN
jgi:hypothetical protein